MKRITLIILLFVSMVYGQEPNNIAEPTITIAKLENELQDKINLIARLREDLGKERKENERLRELCKKFGADDSVKNSIPEEKKPRSSISNAQSVNKQQTNNTIPSQVRMQIQQKAQSKWPNDYEMQKYTIDNELEAYRSLQNISSLGVPKDIFLQIQQKAQSEWPDDYEMQKYTIDNELEAYRSLDSAKSHSQQTNEEPAKDVSSAILNKIKQRVIREYPDNYSVQEMLIKSEVEAYNFIQSYTNTQVPPNILQKIKQKVAREYPDNYSVQEMLIKSEVESYLNLNAHEGH